MNYYPLFRVRSWNNGMRCVSLYILMPLIANIWYVSMLRTHSCTHTPKHTQIYHKHFAQCSCFNVLARGFVLFDLPMYFILRLFHCHKGNGCSSAGVVTSRKTIGKQVKSNHKIWWHNRDKTKCNKCVLWVYCKSINTLIARFMGPTWDPPVDDRT